MSWPDPLTFGLATWALYHAAGALVCGWELVSWLWFGAREPSEGDE